MHGYFLKKSTNCRFWLLLKGIVVIRFIKIIYVIVIVLVVISLIQLPTFSFIYFPTNDIKDF